MEFTIAVLVGIGFMIFIRLGQICDQIKISGDRNISVLEESLRDIREEIVKIRSELPNDIS